MFCQILRLPTSVVPLACLRGSGHDAGFLKTAQKFQALAHGAYSFPWILNLLSCVFNVFVVLADFWFGVFKHTPRLFPSAEQVGRILLLCSRVKRTKPEQNAAQSALLSKNAWEAGRSTARCC